MRDKSENIDSFIHISSGNLESYFPVMMDSDDFKII